MFLNFIYQLRAHKLPVGTHEALTLAQALQTGLHESSLDGFYYVARSLLVHHEANLDAFDLAFAAAFEGAENLSLEIHQQLLDWLKEASSRRNQLSQEELAMLEQFDRETLEQHFKDRLKEQKEKHSGGNKWIGTGGTSPFGHSGAAARPGIRVGGEGMHRSAVWVAQQRTFQAYREDQVLDIRQFGIALRKLRTLAREGVKDEVDLDATIDATAKNLGDLEVITQAKERSNTRVLLFMDVGGSMDVYSELVSKIFSAAQKATHFRELRTFYFHNCIYSRVYQDAGFRKPMALSQLFSETNKEYQAIIVGDALMAPWELLDRSGWYDPSGEGMLWLKALRSAFPRSVWLNPEPQSAWHQTTIALIAQVFPMYTLTLEGLSQAISNLAKTQSTVVAL